MELSMSPDILHAFQSPNSGVHSHTSAHAPPPPLATTGPPATPVKPALAGFRKVCRTEDPSPGPFQGLDGALEMRVKEGSKIRNLMGFAVARMQEGGSGGGPRQVVFTGSGRAVTKTITCAEIMKRRLTGLHQLTKLRYRAVREVWESGDGQTTVQRDVPSISILLSKDPLDPLEPGYQPPEDQSPLWGPGCHREEETEMEKPSQEARKRPQSPDSLLSTKRPCPGVRSLESTS
ncbi:ribonuclease P protein subunit p25-like [Brienomyrus brachyistius]|uniref:ribonuclease P protein subunit p25-like n=1 Tax=Brienomyrus brachyistius TaxID=42636 RepID=UPI0020B3FE56|nr:ribonuclease P protein subunit p25-like [Brienomyrus brachyistius]